MARQTIPIGAGERVLDHWHEWTFAANARPEIDAALTDAVGRRFLTFLRVACSSAAGGNQVTLAAGQTRPGSRAGDDLSAAWEAHDSALTLRAGNLSLAIPGPGASAAEPYTWNVGAARLAAQRAFLDAFAALPQADRDAALLILDDGAPLPPLVEIRIPAALALAHRSPPAPLQAGVRWRRAIRSLTPDRGLLAAVIISHPKAAEPARIVSGARDRVLGGFPYLGAPFTWRLANDEPDRPPRSQLLIPWAGREMAELLESTDGGVGGRVELSEWSFDPDNPDAAPEAEWRVRLSLTAAKVGHIKDGRFVAGTPPQLLVVDLGVTPRADRPAVSMRYTPESDPWLYA